MSLPAFVLHCRISSSITKRLAKFKATGYEVGDRVRVEMSEIFSNVIKAGNKKQLQPRNIYRFLKSKLGGGHRRTNGSQKISNSFTI
jgi:hypothetical protein